MKENMPDTHGEVDRGPRKEHEDAKCGPVTITSPDGTVTVRPAYTDAEVKEIIRQGKEEPRRLTLEESRTAARNRAESYNDRLAMESWYEEVSREADPDLPSWEIGGVTLPRATRR